MSDIKNNSYDDVPYESYPIRQSHPNQIGTIAHLSGMTPKPVEQCRVLELGCASGGNIVPQAIVYPDSQFVGVDLSGRQIAEGRETINALGLRNVELKHASILDVDESYGEFDYIVCHGVFSWVPKEVQEKILDISYRNLAPQGVAYVSYNTYPGWHMRGMVRNMMRYHTQIFDDPQMKVRQARALLDFLAKAVPSEKSPYGLRLRQELEWLQKKADHYLYHEHLEEVNEPEYFHQFVERAGRHNLQYLGEAIYNQSAMGIVSLPAEIERTLRRVTSDLTRMEQYLDFVRNRTFRQTLLCRDDVTLSRQITPEQLSRLYVACPARPGGDAKQAASARPMEFVHADGSKLSTQSPLLKSAICCLAKVWPHAMTVSELLEQSQTMLEAERSGGASVPQQQPKLEELAVRLYKCYISNFVQLTLTQPRFVTEISHRPTAFSLARYQAQRVPRVTNMKHEVVPLPEFHRQLLQRLDGQRDQNAVVEELVDLKLSGKLFVEREGEIAGDRDTVAGMIQNRLDQGLRHFAAQALLVG